MDAKDAYSDISEDYIENTITFSEIEKNVMKEVKNVKNFGIMIG